MQAVYYSNSVRNTILKFSLYLKEVTEYTLLEVASVVGVALLIK